MSYATLVGCTVVQNQAGSAVYYTPPIAREALEATFSVEATHFISAGSVVVTVEHKDPADTSWADLASFTSITAVGTSTKDVSGIKEMVRLKFTFTTTGADAAVHLIVPAPAWRPY